MYFADSLACSHPNSATPMSAGAISRQDARVAAIGAKFDAGDQTLNALITALGGDAVPSGSGDAGIPTTGVFSWFGIPSRNGGGGIPLSIGPGGSGPLVFTAANAACSGPPKVLPFQSVFPIPGPVVPIAQSSPAPPPRAAVTPVPVVQASPLPDTRPDPPGCSPANICAGLRDGCYLSSQVSPQQLLACAMAGWSGNRNLYPWLLARGGAGGGRFFGTPVPNPPQYSGAGVGDLASGPGSAVLWGSLAAGGFLLWAAFGQGRRVKHR